MLKWSLIDVVIEILGTLYFCPKFWIYSQKPVKIQLMTHGIIWKGHNKKGAWNQFEKFWILGIGVTRRVYHLCPQGVSYISLRISLEIRLNISKTQKKIILKFFLGVGPCVWSFASWALLCCSTRYSQDQMNNKKSPNRLNHRDIQRPFQYYKNCLILAPEKNLNRSIMRLSMTGL